jgi:hypothetical protein
VRPPANACRRTTPQATGIAIDSQDAEEAPVAVATPSGSLARSPRASNRLGPVFLADLRVDLRPVHRDLRGRLDPKTHLPPRGRKQDYLNVIADHDALFWLTSQNQHTDKFANRRH